MVRVRNAAVMGFAGWPPEGCWATRLTGRASASTAAYEMFMRSPGKMTRSERVILVGYPRFRNGGWDEGRARVRERPAIAGERRKPGSDCSPVSPAFITVLPHAHRDLRQSRYR